MLLLHTSLPSVQHGRVTKCCVFLNIDHPYCHAQAWLAVHGPLLRRAAAKDSLWGRVLSSVGRNLAAAAAPAAAPDLAHRGPGLPTEDSPADLVAQQAARSYRAECLQVMPRRPSMHAGLSWGFPRDVLQSDMKWPRIPPGLSARRWHPAAHAFRVQPCKKHLAGSLLCTGVALMTGICGHRHKLFTMYSLALASMRSCIPLYSP